MQPQISDQILYSFLTGRFRSFSSTTTTTTTATSSFYPFAIEETIPQEKTHAAMKNHKEAERRRRERINSHLNILRNLLSCNSKTDKATLLAKVVQRVKELKQQTLQVSDQTLPSEEDDINVLHFEDCSKDVGRVVFKVSFCCEDRPNVLQDLVEILNSLEMNILYVDMTTIGGRMRSFLVVSADKEKHGVESVKCLQNALKSLVQRSSDETVAMERRGGEKSKRRRAIDHIIMV